jgi:hypothetical protein
VRAPDEQPRVTTPKNQLDEDVLEKLQEGLESCPDVAFAYLADVEVVGGDHRSATTLFVWLVPAAVRSLRPALNLVSEVVAAALPEDRFLDVAILNSAPELLQDVERADCLLVVRDAGERQRALRAAAEPGIQDEPENGCRWWWPF